MANQDNNTNFMDTMLGAQKKMVDTMMENTQKLTGGNTIVNETMQKGSEWYKNWLDNQKNIFTQTTSQAAAGAEKVQESAQKTSDFFQNWMNTQMNAAKQMWDMSQNWFRNAQPADAANPMAQWSQMMNNWSASLNNWNQAGNWMNQMQQMNPFNTNAWKQQQDSFSTFTNQWNEMLNTTFADWQKNFQSGTIQDAYKNMVNTAEGFSRFYQIWAPMWQSVQDKTFNKELFAQFMNPAQYKELMDKFFGFMPEQSRQYFQQMGQMMQDSAKQMGQAGMDQFQQIRSMMGQMPFNMPAGDLFGQMLNGWNQWTAMIQNSVSPISRMMTPNQHTKNMQEWAEISNRMMVFNIKNAELQYMIYNQGTKVMDQLAEHVMNKIRNGEEVSSIMALYQEWMNLSDKTFVSLFESDAYSQLMAEVSALQLRLKKDMELQMEGMMSGLPIATRSELDELYRTIYDLKKQVRQLEKMLEINTEESAPAEPESRQSAPNHNPRNKKG